MESSYKEIYKLQDDILDLVFSRDAPWYLTGGTALSRFYFSHRYSDDLDFFSLETISFAENFREEKEKLIRVWPQSDAQIDSRDFKRIEVRPGKTYFSHQWHGDQHDQSQDYDILHRYPPLKWS